MYARATRIVIIGRIIATICIHIIAKEITVCIDVSSIYVQKSSPLRVIVSTLEIIESRLNIVVITTVAEGVIAIYNAVFQRRIAADCLYGVIAPRVIEVCTDLFAEFVVNCNDVALQVLFEEEHVELICGIHIISIFQSDWRTAFIVDVDHCVFRVNAAAFDINTAAKTSSLLRLPW